jgi:6-phosphogluconolactonase
MGMSAALLGAGAVPAAAATGRSVHLLAGTYRGGGARGLYPVTFDLRTAAWSIGDPIEAVSNASFGVRARRSGRRYLLNEQRDGQVGTWRDGAEWHLLGTAPTAGGGPCHVTLDATETCLAVANYGTGNIAFYRLDPKTGVPIAPPTVRQNEGHGADPEAQKGPHAHWVGFSRDQRWLHSVDLGTDQILSYPFDARAGAIGEALVACQAPAGSGPRHLALHPRLAKAYLLCELGSKIIQLDVTGDGRFEMAQILSTLPADFAAHDQSAHLTINRAGTRLYLSNRGHDSIAVFAIDAAGGLSLLQHVSARGSWPRFFLLLEAERRLIVANQRAGELAAFTVAADGRLAPVGEVVKVPGVVFLDRR